MKTGFTMAAAAIGSMVALYLVVVYPDAVRPGSR